MNAIQFVKMLAEHHGSEIVEQAVQNIASSIEGKNYLDRLMTKNILTAEDKRYLRKYVSEIAKCVEDALASSAAQFMTMLTEHHGEAAVTAAVEQINSTAEGKKYLDHLVTQAVLSDADKGYLRKCVSHIVCQASLLSARA